MRKTPRRWPLLRQAFRQAELMDKMMRAVGVDEVSAARLDHGEAIAKAREACLKCNSHCRCLQFLDNLDHTASAPEFCLNTKFFEQCAASKDKEDPRE